SIATLANIPFIHGSNGASGTRSTRPPPAGLSSSHAAPRARPDTIVAALVDDSRIASGIPAAAAPAHTVWDSRLPTPRSGSRFEREIPPRLDPAPAARWSHAVRAQGAPARRAT